MTPLVIGMGVAVSDYLINVDHLPRPNQGAHANSHSWQFGGKVATGMAALGRLGVPCAYATVVGDDPDGWANRDDFRFNGVDTTPMVFDPAWETGYCVVLSDLETGGRSILGGNRRIRLLQPEDLNEAYFRQAKYLHVERGAPAERQAAQWVREGGGQVLVDADGYNEELEQFLPLTDVFIPSEFYYKTRYGEADPMECCRQMRALGPHTVIITLGEQGCVGIGPEGEFRLPAFRVPVVDTTGAGDVFHGAYFYGLTRGWPAVECARFASAVSAIKCTAIGGRAALPTPEVVERFLATGELDRGYIEERLRHYSSPPRAQREG